MQRSRILESITTKYIVLTVACIVVAAVAIFIIILTNKLTDTDTLSKFVDAVFKTVAILVGAVWALNRYYTGRIDVAQIRVDSDVKIVRDKKFKSNGSNVAILIYRLDIINTGKTLIPSYQQFLMIEAVTPSSKGTQLVPLYRWPVDGMHPGGPIEPGSWAALNDAVTVPADIVVVHIYIEIESPKKKRWNWHKTFDVSEVSSNE